jgi:ribosomal protein L40E
MNSPVASLLSISGLVYHIFDRITNSISKRIQQEKMHSKVSENNIYCRFCGKKNPVSRTSCQACKMRTDIAPSEILKVCSKCGTAINNDDIYCIRCGTADF